MANILIVGANQGIGYYLTEKILELGHSVTVLDIEISGVRNLQEKYPDTLLPIIADAQQLESIESGVLFAQAQALE